jgi:hypothetical protein
MAPTATGVGDTSDGKGLTHFVPLFIEQTSDFGGVQRAKRMNEADPGVELWISPEALLHPGHANQHHANVVAVEEIA